ncbi:MAG: hypothetical protein ACFE7R_06045, partial [Candidatus Hodarchaeota archaeon]
EMASEIIDAAQEEEQDDGLTKGEREIESKKEAERIRKAKKLRKQLRKRELGLLQYKWPAAMLILTGILAIWTEFVVIWTQNPVVYGFDTFWGGFTFSGNVFFLFPAISGIILIVSGYLAYSNPKATFLSIIPSMMMSMAGGQIYFLISVVTMANEDIELVPTGAPVTMFIVGLVALLSIFLRERE